MKQKLRGSLTQIRTSGPRSSILSAGSVILLHHCNGLTNQPTRRQMKTVSNSIWWAPLLSVWINHYYYGRRHFVASREWTFNASWGERFQGKFQVSSSDKHFLGGFLRSATREICIFDYLRRMDLFTCGLKPRHFLNVTSWGRRNCHFEIREWPKQSDLDL